MSLLDEIVRGYRAVYERTPGSLVVKGTIAVVGVGGAGSWVALALAVASDPARTRLVLVDPDTLEPSNLNRLPVPATRALRGRGKAEVVAEMILLLRPGIRLNVVEARVEPGNAAEVLEVAGRPDVVVDAVDNVPGSKALEEYCRKRGIPLIRTKYDGLHYTFEYIADWEDYRDKSWGSPTAGGYSTVPSTPATPLRLASLAVVFAAVRPQGNYAETGDLLDALKDADAGAAARVREELEGLARRLDNPGDGQG